MDKLHFQSLNFAQIYWKNVIATLCVLGLIQNMKAFSKGKNIFKMANYPVNCIHYVTVFSKGNSSGGDSCLVEDICQTERSLKNHRGEA